MPVESSQVKTRQQQDLQLALTSINDASKALDEKASKIYGGLCHKMPILTRTCGLCQTLAFIEDKKSRTDERGKAYQHLHADIAKLLGVASGELLSTVQRASLQDYMRYTRRILAAWVYYKRFAVSILKVESGQAEEGK